MTFVYALYRKIFSINFSNFFKKFFKNYLASIRTRGIACIETREILRIIVVMLQSQISSKSGVSSEAEVKSLFELHKALDKRVRGELLFFSTP